MVIYDCPSDKQHACSWYGSADDVLLHFNEEHEDLLLFVNELTIDLEIISENYLLFHEDEIYLIQIRSNPNGELTIILRFLGPSVIVTHFKFDILLKTDTNIELPKNQWVYLSDEGGFKINLNDIKTAFKDVKSLFCEFMIDANYDGYEGTDSEPEILLSIPRVSLNRTLLASKSMYEKTPPNRRKKPSLFHRRSMHDNNISLSIIMELEQGLICTKCKGILKPPVYICENNHNFCYKCKYGMCSLCSAAIKDERNLLLEAKLDNSVYPCKYSDFGCFEKLPYNELGSHELSCVHCHYQCAVSGCSVKDRVNYQTIVEHLSVFHGSIKKFETFVFTFPKNYECLVTQRDLGVFYCKSKQLGESIQWQVIYCGPDDRSFFVELLNKNSDKYVFKRTTGSPVYECTLTTSTMKKQKFKDKHAYISVTTFS